MERSKLGRTQLEVSRLGLGGLFVASALSDFEQARRTVREALDQGINVIDTAPTYYNSEEVLGKALAGYDGPLVFSTKLGGKPKPFDPTNKDCLRQSFEDSLRLLQRDHIDVLFVHEPDRPQQYDWWTDIHTVEGVVLEVLHELRDAGRISHFGLGGTTAYEMAHLCRSGKFSVVLTAFNYSALYREAALEVIPAAVANDMGIVVGSPLHQGALARRFDREVIERARWMSQARRDQFYELYNFVDECGLPLAELGLRFVLSNPDVHCILTGARSPEEVKQNVAAIDKGPLPADILQRLDEIAAKVPYRPFEEPFGIGWILGAPQNYKGTGLP